LEVLGIAPAKLDPGLPAAPAGQRDCRLRDVDAEHASAIADRLGHRLGQETRAAADVDDALARGEAEASQRVPALRGDVRSGVNGLQLARRLLIEVNPGCRHHPLHNPQAC
jgi:hypothetical protein